MTTRHLYNQTAVGLDVVFIGGSLPDLAGAAYVPNNDTEVPPGWWEGTLPAGGTCALEFDSNSGSIQVNVTGGVGFGCEYNFGTNDLDSDPTWQHSGDTQNVNLNDPSDGDFTVYSVAL